MRRHERRKRRRQLSTRDLKAILEVATGAFDARGEQFGEERVHDLVAAGHGATASELLALVQTAVDTFTAGAAQEDDMTVAVVHHIASP